MAATFSALDDDDVGAKFLGFCCVLNGATSRHANHAAVFQGLDEFGARSAVVASCTDALANNCLRDDVGPGCVHQEVHAEGTVRELFDLKDRGFHF